MRTRELLLCRRECSIVRQLQAEGINVSIPDEWIEPAPLMVEECDRYFGTVWNDHGIALYAIPFRIVSEGRVIVCDFEIYSEWMEFKIELLEIRGKNGRYRYGGFDYSLDEILNERFASGFRLGFRGDMLEGVLIGHGGALPREHGKSHHVAVYVTLIDSLRRRSQESRSWLEVRERQQQRDKIIPRPSDPTPQEIESTIRPVREPVPDSSRVRTTLWD